MFALLYFSFVVVGCYFVVLCFFVVVCFYYDVLAESKESTKKN